MCITYVDLLYSKKYQMDIILAKQHSFSVGQLFSYYHTTVVYSFIAQIYSITIPRCILSQF